jgi:hypothetical protein
VSSDENDLVVNRATEELRRLPPLDREAVDRVVRAAAEARVSPADGEELAARRRVRSIRVWSAVGLAAAAAVAGFVAGELRPPRSTPIQQTAAAPTSGESTMALRQVANDPSVIVAIPSQFVFEHKTARRVSIVGDFNNWDPKANEMVRDASGFWSVILPVMPGRHLYGFMVDDSVFTLDPRKPKARDPDLGGEGSVLMVGRP